MEQAGEVDYLITWRDNEFVGRVSLTPCGRAGANRRCFAFPKASVAFVRRVQWLQQFSDTWVVERFVPTAIMFGINLTAFQLARIVYLEIQGL